MTAATGAGQPGGVRVVPNCSLLFPSRLLRGADIIIGQALGHVDAVPHCRAHRVLAVLKLWPSRLWSYNCLREAAASRAAAGQRWDSRFRSPAGTNSIFSASTRSALSPSAAQLGTRVTRASFVRRRSSGTSAQAVSGCNHAATSDGSRHGCVSAATERSK